MQQRCQILFMPWCGIRARKRSRHVLDVEGCREPGELCTTDNSHNRYGSVTLTTTDSGCSIGGAQQVRGLFYCSVPAEHFTAPATRSKCCRAQRWVNTGRYSVHDGTLARNGLRPAISRPFALVAVRESLLSLAEGDGRRRCDRRIGAASLSTTHGAASMHG
jgi:hypothetical protein